MRAGLAPRPTNLPPPLPLPPPPPPFPSLSHPIYTQPHTRTHAHPLTCNRLPAEKPSEGESSGSEFLKPGVYAVTIPENMAAEPGEAEEYEEEGGEEEKGGGGGGDARRGGGGGGGGGGESDDEDEEKERDKAGEFDSDE